MKLRQTTAFFLLLSVLPAVCAAGPLRQYNAELGETVTLVRNGALKQALAQVEKNNENDADGDQDILYFFEKGELFSLGGNYGASRNSWLKSDAVIQAWENDFRTNPAKLFGDIGGYLISDKTRRYEGQDYEKVLLSTRLTLNHIMLGDFDHARIEMKKTYEREKLIEAFREKEYDALKEAADKQSASQPATLDGYPMDELDTPEVRALKNGFQNAFAHYLAGYFFEVTDETSLAEPGYRNALQLASGKAIIQNALDGIGKRRPAPGEADVLFVVESGFAPSFESLNIPIPIPRQNGVVVTQLSFPLIKSSPPVLVPPVLTVAGRNMPVETLTNTDAMARRLLKDQMPGIILRTVIRAAFKSVVQEQANKTHWLVGLVANVAAVSTEQADDRNWRTLPERISVARANLPHGRHAIEFQTDAGSYRAEIEVLGRFAIVPIRITGGAVYVGQPGLAQRSAPDFVAAQLFQPGAAGLSAPVPAVVPFAEPAAAVASAVPLVLSSPAVTIAEPAPAAGPVVQPMPLPSDGKRVTIGDTTYIGDFRFAQPSGLPSGRGVVEWSNGDRFEGTLENGRRQGQGIYISKAGGSRYAGGWLADKKNGRGKTTFDDGDVYEGEMRDGEFHGHGVYSAKDGTRYEGSLKKGLKDGQGKLTFPDGDAWEGIFSNDQPTDQGRMSFAGRPAKKPDSE